MNTITISLAWLGTLCATFVAKQFLADWLFQTSWMALGKAELEGWLAPLLAHAGVHAALTLVLMLVLRPSLWWLAAVDFMLHAVIDYGKTSVTRGLGLTARDNAWWWLIGFDQALHELTHLAFILAVLATG
jgi:hypothetical protein